MEHSYLTGHLVGAITNFMLEREGYFRVVWAGDYADPEPDGKPLYILTDLVHLDPMKLRKTGAPVAEVRWLYNLDKGEVVDLTKCPKDSEGWAIHPLPLLCCNSNGRGGGDYNGTSMELVGSWVKDRIMVRPDALVATDWKELVPNFLEK